MKIVLKKNLTNFFFEKNIFVDFFPSKKNIFFGVDFFFGYSFEPEKAYLSIGEVFRAIPARRSRDISNR